MSGRRPLKRSRSLDREYQDRRGRPNRQGPTSRIEDRRSTREDGIAPKIDNPNRAGRLQFSGLIFMCNSETKRDCFRYRVMGLPMVKRDFVKNIVPGMKLFLYDFDSRELYGIFEAASYGGLDLEPEAFRSCKGSYPAQVRFRLFEDCLPLPEEVFSNAIRENFYHPHKFDFDLSEEQVARLIRLFRPVESLVNDPRRRLAMAPPPHGLPEGGRLGLEDPRYARHRALSGMKADAPPMVQARPGLDREPMDFPRGRAPPPVPESDLLGKYQMEETDALALKYIQKDGRFPDRLPNEAIGGQVPLDPFRRGNLQPFERPPPVGAGREPFRGSRYTLADRRM